MITHLQALALFRECTNNTLYMKSRIWVSNSSANKIVNILNWLTIFLVILCGAHSGQRRLLSTGLVLFVKHRCGSDDDWRRCMLFLLWLHDSRLRHGCCCVRRVSCMITTQFFDNISQQNQSSNLESKKKSLKSDRNRQIILTLISFTGGSAVVICVIVVEPLWWHLTKTRRVVFVRWLSTRVIQLATLSLHLYCCQSRIRHNT